MSVGIGDTCRPCKAGEACQPAPFPAARNGICFPERAGMALPQRKLRPYKWDEGDS